MQAIKKHNLSVYNKHQANYQKMIKELADSPNMSRRLKSAGSETVLSSPMSRTFGTLSTPEVIAHKKAHHELVAANLLRLQRSEQHNLSQQRQRIEHKENRMQHFNDKKLEAEKTRWDVLKHTTHVRNLIRDQLEVAARSPPEKMIPMLAKLDPDPEAVDHINLMLHDFGLPQLGGGTKSEEDKDEKKK